MNHTNSLSDDQLRALKDTPLGAMPNKVRLARTLVSARAGDVAAAIGITKPYFSAIEGGKYKDVPIESVGRPLSEFFNCAIEDLFPARSENTGSEVPKAVNA